MQLGWHDAAWGWAGLVLAAGVVLFLMLRGRGGGRWRGKSKRWWAAGVILPVLMAVAVCLAMAGIVIEIRRPAAVRVYLDLSASTRGSDLQSPEFLRRLIESRLGGGRRVEVMGFGGAGAGGPRVILQGVLAGDRAAWPETWPREITDALAGNSAGGGAEGGGLAAVFGRNGAADAAQWIVTDGLIPTGDVPEEAVKQGLVAWTIVAPGQLDAGVRDVQLRPAANAARKPAVDVLAEVRVAGPVAAGGGRARDGAVRVETDFFRDGVKIAGEIVSFSGGVDGHMDAAKWISVRDDFGGEMAAAGLPHRYRVNVKLLAGVAGGDGNAAGGDLWPENDWGEAVWPGGGSGAVRVLVVGEKTPVDLQRFGAAEFVPAEQFFGDVRGWVAQGWQAIVLDDVPAEKVTAASGEILQPISAEAARGVSDFVTQSGGGLLILGNGHAFGPGHYGEGGGWGAEDAGDILENLSPVSSHPQTGGGLAVVYLLDASASMNEAVAVGGAGESRGAGGQEKKFALLARAVEDSAGLLAAGDQVTLIAFSDRAQRLFSGHAPANADDERKLAALLGGVEPEGATVPDAALDQVADAVQHPAGDHDRRLVILVTDGEIPAMDAAKWKAALAGAELCVVAPERSSASPLKELIGAFGGSARWLKTDDPQNWGQVLTRRVAEQVEGTVQHAPLVYGVDNASGSAAATEGHTGEWTQVWAKPEAVVTVKGTAVATAGGNWDDVTLAAWGQRGLGRVGAIAMSDDGSAGYAAAYRAMVGRVAGAQGDRRFTLRALRAAGGGWMLTADGIELPISAGAGTRAAGNDSVFVDGQVLEARIFLGAGEPQQIPMPQTGPGRYAAHVGINGGWSAAVIRRGGGGREELVGHVQAADVQTTEWPASVDRPIDPEGVRLPAGESGPIWNPEVKQTVSLSVPLWLIAVAAGLLALFLRK